MSELVGVSKTPSGKWIGHVKDVLYAAQNPGNTKKKTLYTRCFDTQQEAVAARAELKQTNAAKLQTFLNALAKANPRTKHLEQGPYNLLEAVHGRRYWLASHMTHWRPTPMVVQKHGKQGFQWVKACVHCDVNDAKMAILDSRVVSTEPSCQAHGGKCIHGKLPSHCMQCTFDSGKQLMGFCSKECGTRLDRKRQLSTGGNGLCPGCETRSAAEAAEAGSEPPAKGRSWEALVLDQLVTMVVDTEGHIICHEMRDDKSNMFGSNKRQNKGKCNTDHQRRPDVLWLVRSAESRIVAAVMVEVDEDSHTSRESDCETGKVHDRHLQFGMKMAIKFQNTRCFYHLALSEAYKTVNKIKIEKRLHNIFDACPSAFGCDSQE